MNTSSMSVCRRDEWTALLLCAMKTSLSVAHELGLSPDAVLDCAARHLKFRDFASFASAIHGASRAYACCARRENVSAVEVAYIKTLAARVDSDRDVLARVPTMCCSSSDLQSHREAADLAYEKVVAAVQALKDDVHRSFSQGGVLSDSAVAGASGFARALAEIMSTDEDVGAYERAVTAILKVRFAVRYPLVDDVADAHDTEQDQDVNVHSGVPPLSTAANGWMQRVKDVVHHPASLHK